MDFETRQDLRRRIRKIAEPVVRSVDCDLVAVEMTGDRTGPVLRLYVDSPQGVGVGDCTRISHLLSPELDVEDPIPVAYRLEVSSPGIDRPVELPQDFERFKGYTAKVRMAPDWGRKRYKGELGGLRDDRIVLRIGDKEHLLPRDRVLRVRLDLSLEEFARLGEPAVGVKSEDPADTAPTNEAASAGDRHT